MCLCRRTHTYTLHFITQTKFLNKNWVDEFAKNTSFKSKATKGHGKEIYIKEIYCHNFYINKLTFLNNGVKVS